MFRREGILQACVRRNSSMRNEEAQAKKAHDKDD